MSQASTKATLQNARQTLDSLRITAQGGSALTSALILTISEVGWDEKATLQALTGIAQLFDLLAQKAGDVDMTGGAV